MGSACDMGTFDVAVVHVCNATLLTGPPLELHLGLKFRMPRQHPPAVVSCFFWFGGDGWLFAVVWCSGSRSRFLHRCPRSGSGPMTRVDVSVGPAALLEERLAELMVLLEREPPVCCDSFAAKDLRIGALMLGYLRLGIPP